VAPGRVDVGGSHRAGYKMPDQLGQSVACRTVDQEGFL
jgi:hypothetical protein